MDLCGKHEYGFCAYDDDASVLRITSPKPKYAKRLVYNASWVILGIVSIDEIACVCVCVEDNG